MTSLIPIDTHTHLPYSTPGIAIEQGDFRTPHAMEPGRYYSVGIHPQQAAHGCTDAGFELLRHTALHPQVLAIGEAGLDKNCPNLPLQMELFHKQAEIACEADKPVIIHLVGAADELLHIHRRFKAHTPWIVHGFRRKPQLARQLLSQGLYLSYGIRHNPESLRSTPLHRLFLETDDYAEADIRTVYRQAAQTLGMDEEILRKQLITNICQVFFKR